MLSNSTYEYKNPWPGFIYFKMHIKEKHCTPSHWKAPRWTHKAVRLVYGYHLVSLHCTIFHMSTMLGWVKSFPTKISKYGTGLCEEQAIVKRKEYHVTETIVSIEWGQQMIPNIDKNIHIVYQSYQHTSLSPLREWRCSTIAPEAFHLPLANMLK